MAGDTTEYMRALDKIVLGAAIVSVVLLIVILANADNPEPEEPS